MCAEKIFFFSFSLNFPRKENSYVIWSGLSLNMLLEFKPQQGFSFSLPSSYHPVSQRLRSATVRLPQLGKFSLTISSESEPMNLKLTLFPTLITFQSQRMQFRARLQIPIEFRNAFLLCYFRNATRRQTCLTRCYLHNQERFTVKALRLAVKQCSSVAQLLFWHISCCCHSLQSCLQLLCFVVS